MLGLPFEQAVSIPTYALACDLVRPTDLAARP